MTDKYIPRPIPGLQAADMTRLTKSIQLTESLTALVRPYVEPLVIANLDKLDKELATAPQWNLSHEQIEEIKKAIESAVDEEATEEQREELLEALRHPSPPTPTDLQQEREEAIQEACDQLISGWMQELVLAQLEAGTTEISAASLDDAMLPPMSAELTEAFDMDFNGVLLDAAQAREVLRAIRRSLPAGQVLPEAMVEYLSCQGIKIV